VIGIENGDETAKSLFECKAVSFDRLRINPEQVEGSAA